MMKKMIALDLDNTLLNSNNVISAHNVRILRHLHGQGVKVVLCTGRPINAIWPYIKQLELLQSDDFTITFNGGLVINNQTRKPLFRSGLSKQALGPLHTFMCTNHLPLDVLDFDKVYELGEQRSLYRGMIENITFERVTFDQLVGGDYLYAKAILALPPVMIAKVKEQVLQESSILEQVQVVQSQDDILEFLPKMVNKSVGLKHLLAYFRQDFGALVAFGDADNDSEMLAAAGDGVVMANGQPQIKLVADHETLSNDEDGVADYLEKSFATLLS